MEVEVKLTLPNAESHAKFKSLIAQSHVKTVHQHNIFFDTPTSALSSKCAILRLRFLDGATRCVISLKARAVLVDGVSRVEEDEEDIDADLGFDCVCDPPKLASIDSRIVRRCKDEFGDDGEFRTLYLGAFENVRDVYEWRGLQLEVDETKYEFGVRYEIECETEDPEKARDELEGFLKENGIEYKYSEMSPTVMATLHNKTKLGRYRWCFCQYRLQYGRDCIQ